MLAARTKRRPRIVPEAAGFPLVRFLAVTVVLLMAVLLEGCRVVTGVFDLGVGVGVVAVLGVLAMVGGTAAIVGR